MEFPVFSLLTGNFSSRDGVRSRLPPPAASPLSQICCGGTALPLCQSRAAPAREPVRGADVAAGEGDPGNAKEAGCRGNLHPITARLPRTRAPPRRRHSCRSRGDPVRSPRLRTGIADAASQIAVCEGGRVWLCRSINLGELERGHAPRRRNPPERVGHRGAALRRGRPAVVRSSSAGETTLRSDFPAAASTTWTATAGAPFGRSVNAWFSER